MFHASAPSRLDGVWDRTGPRRAAEQPSAVGGAAVVSPQLEVHHQVWLLSAMISTLHDALEHHPLPHPHFAHEMHPLYPHRESLCFEVARMSREMGHL